MLEEALQAGEKRYRVFVEQLPVGVYRTTPDGKVMEANTALARMLGLETPASLQSYNVVDFFIKKTDRMRLLKKLESKSSHFTEFELRRVDGRRFWVRDYSQSVKGPDGASKYYDGILLDITELKRAKKKVEQALRKYQAANEELKGLSLKDDLTGLSNRREFFTLGQQHMKVAKRLRKGMFLLYIDVDQLKKTNDSYGHPAGDRVLTSVAAMLRETLRESEIIARIGGDEFAVLAMSSKKGGEKNLRSRLEEKIRIHNLGNPRRFHMALSIGIVRYDPRKFASLEEFLAHGDYLMYQEKRSKTATLP
jgi:diguanylate cyclase (GGDEF)-like protein/PAS domain S-box-containing protein